jgi:hypothetical protein
LESKKYQSPPDVSGGLFLSPLCRTLNAQRRTLHRTCNRHIQLPWEKPVQNCPSAESHAHAGLQNFLALVLNAECILPRRLAACSLQLIDPFSLH